MIPARWAIGFNGAHIHPPDQAVVPPSTGSFSATITLRPCQAAVTAADSPPAPEPITRRSHSACWAVGGAIDISASIAAAYDRGARG